MFEIKAWNISAPLKADISAAKQDNPGVNDVLITSKKSLKRKRNQKKNEKRAEEVTITDDSLGELWSHYVEDMGQASGDKIGHGKRDTHHNKLDEKKSITANSKEDVRTGVRQSHNKIARDFASQQAEREKPSGLDGQIKKKQQKKKTTRPAISQPSRSQNANEDSQISKSSSTTQIGQTPAVLTSLQSKMSHKLASARFRHLNEQLYTKPSSESLQSFQENPDMFADYHTGFAQQVAVWPENPVHSYIQDVLNRAKACSAPFSGQKKHKRQRYDNAQDVKGVLPLPRSRLAPHECVIADLGCGTAGLATALQPHLSKLHLKVHSFDLHSPSPLVTRADIANLPLPDGQVDVAIFCLALMGTNWIEFVEEAWRVLREKGELWVAEIKSRFARPRMKTGGNNLSKRKAKSLNSKEGKRLQVEKEEQQNDEALAVEVDGVQGPSSDTDVTAFVGVLHRRGFLLDGEVDLSNKMFVKMRFVKTSTGGNRRHQDAGTVRQPLHLSGAPKKFVEPEEVDAVEEGSVLKPCVYKLR